ncbi:MAG: FAD-binding oxidoreductase [Armatimonadota bacterium]
MSDNLIRPWNSEYEDYLHDESRSTGTADSISFPKSESEVVEVVQAVRDQRGTITIQGARTGITAGAVPNGGHLLNLSRMNRIGDVTADVDGGHFITVEPGAILSDIRKVVDSVGLFFPPDPTETSATVGGMVSCNASGAMSFLYGPTRNWVKALSVVLSSGSVVRLRRGECFADGRSFTLDIGGNRIISGRIPDYNIPSVKSAAGYYAADNMDLIDLFIGSEGTLGIVTEIELKLIEKPECVTGLTVFFPDEDSAVKYVRYLRGEAVESLPTAEIRPAAIEFFNSDALNLLRAMKSNPAFAKIPALQPHFHTAVYTEFHGADEAVEDAVMQATEALIELGASDDDTWFADNERELEPIKAFRHATPEAVNLLIGERKKAYPEITKLGTDMSVPDQALERTMAMYNDGLIEAGLESIIFGHIGNNHLHVNILPNDMDEYSKGKQLYMEWAKKIVEIGGSVSAEHGIGKLKAPFLELMYGQEGIKQMKSLKHTLDPANLLNPRDLFVMKALLIG